MENTKREFETVTCSRCGGSGEYSYCQMYGTRCFKCHGSGRIYTKRGEMAHEFYVNLLSKRADALVAGDVIMADNFFSGKKWYKVASVTPHDNSQSHSFKNGVEQPKRSDLLNIDCEGFGWHGVAPETMVRVSHTAEQKQPKFTAAMEYQDTLTKQGTLRKR